MGRVMEESGLEMLRAVKKKLDPKNIFATHNIISGRAEDTNS